MPGGWLALTIQILAEHGVREPAVPGKAPNALVSDRLFQMVLSLAGETYQEVMEVFGLPQAAICPQYELFQTSRL